MIRGGTYCLAVILLIQAVPVGAQDWEPMEKNRLSEVARLMNERYAGTDAYRIDIAMASFKGHGSTTPHDTANGYYLRYGAHSINYQLGVRVVQDDKCTVSIDEADKIIVVTPSIGEMRPMDELDLQGAIASCSKAFERSSRNKTTYRTEHFPGDRLEATEFTVDEKGWLISLELFYSEALRENPSDPVATATKPKVIVQFTTKVIDRKRLDAELFRTANYVRWEENKPFPVKNGYEVFDARVQ